MTYFTKQNWAVFESFIKKEKEKITIQAPFELKRYNEIDYSKIAEKPFLSSFLTIFPWQQWAIISLVILTEVSAGGRLPIYIHVYNRTVLSGFKMVQHGNRIPRDPKYWTFDLELYRYRLLLLPACCRSPEAQILLVVRFWHQLNFSKHCNLILLNS